MATKSPYTALIVEDNLLVSTQLRSFFNTMNWEAETLDTAEAVIERLSDFPYDLVIMDINLKGDKTGIDAALSIRDKYSIPIVFVSALSELREHSIIEEMQNTFKIPKPISNRDLMEVIESLG